jgi:hypothetical protein
MRRCLICGRPLPPVRGRGRPRLYCSPHCRRAREHLLRRLQRRARRERYLAEVAVLLGSDAPRR